MNLTNLTPHTVQIESADGTIITIAPSGQVPRISTEKKHLGQVTQDRIPLFKTSFGEPEGLPEQQEGVLLIVSAMVAEHPSLSNRTDLVSPGAPIRDSEGRIIGAKGLNAGPGLAATYN